MKLRAALMACLVANAAYADGKHTLVLKADGNADGKTRKEVDAAVLKLAKTSAEGVAAGDISFNDAAAAVGCTKPDAPTCKDDVLGMFSVDEVIATTVTRKPGGFEVVVRREPKTGAPREVTATITGVSDPQLDNQVGTLFGASAPLTPPELTTPTSPPETHADTAARDRTPTPPETTPTPPETTPTPPPPVLPPVTEDQQHTRLQLAGMIGGGGLVLLGLVMGGHCMSGTQSDIDNAPSRTVANLQHIQDLEKQGDGQASFGNLLFVGGLVLGGVSSVTSCEFRQISSRRPRSGRADHAHRLPPRRRSRASPSEARREARDRLVHPGRALHRHQLLGESPQRRLRVHEAVGLHEPLALVCEEDSLHRPRWRADRRPTRPTGRRTDADGRRQGPGARCPLSVPSAVYELQRRLSHLQDRHSQVLQQQQLQRWRSVLSASRYDCTIGCNVDGACRNGVVCTDAEACVIQCGGANSCKNVQCGDGPCSVDCSGTSSCHGVDCGNSCGCDVVCTGNSGTGGAACQNVICTSLQCSQDFRFYNSSSVQLRTG